MLKILYFSRSNQISQISQRIKSLYDWGIKLIYYPGRHNLGPEMKFQQTYQPGKPPGHNSPGHLDRVFVITDI